MCRKRLFTSLCKLHQLNIYHGDFEPRNVVRSGSRVSIIDFSHSSLNHVCPGWRSCAELEEARHKLELGGGSHDGLWANWAVLASMLCGLFCITCKLY
jgi:serine/threonine protein kinase